ncbi:hypothetical protein F5884DRAFT_807418 [Xylogone sp. PMI_703]|nr:hypothetical protein F5884DRAFT_807418 [Xylogone sp. PMI_703]
MTRPQIIRADTIDLQDHNAPSAKDHSKQPEHPAPLGAGPPAPHQAEMLREHSDGTELSKEWDNDDGEDGEDNLAVAQNGGHTVSATEDAEMADAEGDDGLDDDMMDKISSSPSIDDGGYSLPPIPHRWPRRSDSVLHSSPSGTPVSQAWDGSSSPYVEKPIFYPLLARCSSCDYIKTQVSKSTHNYHLLHSGHPAQGDGDIIECQEGETDMADHLAVSASADNDLGDDGSNRSICDHTLPEIDLVYDNSGENHSDDGYDIILNPSKDTVSEVPNTCDLSENEEDDSDDNDIPFDPHPRFIDSGWGGECLQESEDIDFEFVYALHTFVATVEGQANATKGDTMVLLDDSNSYWWLVRVVKDSSIGYLPAEHIETPTERLARLNKHRNIDLTSTMLGDAAEKSKSTLSKIRRKYSKTVTFAAPTYVEASDVDYSTEEEDDSGDLFGQSEQQAETQHDQTQDDEISPVEPLKPRAELRDAKSDSADVDSGARGSSESRNSEEMFEGRHESNRSRNGTVRNTDSFFKDDSVETRKITLTPNLLRDDSSTSTRTSNESKQRASLEKDSPDKAKNQKDKKDKKDKDKKSGMLSGLFKRKDKKSKSQDEDIDELIMGKRSLENARASPAPSKDSEELVSTEEPAQKPNKLHKQPRGESSPTRRPGTASDSKNMETSQSTSTERSIQADSAQTPSMRLVQSEERDEAETSQESEVLRAASSQKPGVSVSTTSRPVQAKQDSLDSSSGFSPIEQQATDFSKQPQRPIPGAFPNSYSGAPADQKNVMEESLSESPVQVSPIATSQSYPPGLTVDSSSQDEPPSPVSSPSPELIEAEDVQEKKGAESTTTSASTPTWSDAHLRTFFDDDSEIKDLLVVVYDKSGVVPAGPDHPITGDLFREENAKLADITNRLDSMLGDWLARKMRTQTIA